MGERLSDRLAADTSRRGFLARVGGAVLAAAGAPTAASLIKPGEAEAFHFCGHIYTTDSCPHPTGIPRVDSRNLPLRAKDGHPVDDLGRLIDKQGRAVDEHGRLLRDLDGAPLPKASRTPVCKAVGETYGFRRSSTAPGTAAATARCASSSTAAATRAAASTATRR